MKLRAKIWKYGKRIGTGVVVLVVLVVGTDAALVLMFSPRSLPGAGETADAVVVLGAAPNSPALFNRTMAGLSLYKSGAGKQLILSGGRTAPEDETEAQNMLKMIARTEKTPPPVILEDASHNTFENLSNAQAKLPNAHSIIIVSDKYHLARAFLVAKKVGFKVVFWDSPNQNYYSKDDLRWYYVREMLALLDYLPKLLF